jgi:predicted DNA binding protein
VVTPDTRGPLLSLCAMLRVHLDLAHEKCAVLSQHAYQVVTSDRKEYTAHDVTVQFDRDDAFASIAYYASMNPERYGDTIRIESYRGTSRISIVHGAAW